MRAHLFPGETAELVALLREHGLQTVDDAPEEDDPPRRPHCRPEWILVDSGLPSYIEILISAGAGVALQELVTALNPVSHCRWNTSGPDSTKRSCRPTQFE